MASSTSDVAIAVAVPCNAHTSTADNITSAANAGNHTSRASCQCDFQQQQAALCLPSIVTSAPIHQVAPVGLPRNMSDSPGDVLVQLLHTVVPLLKSYLNSNMLDNAKVIHFMSPAQLRELLPPLPTSASTATSTPHTPVDHTIDTEALRKLVSVVLQYSTATSHPLFLDKLYTGADPLGQVAELVTAALNTNTHVYAAAPVFSLMERSIIRTLCVDYLGYPLDQHDGLLCPGGSYSNLISMLAARHTHFPHVKADGWRATDRPVCFTSASAHYSIVKGANALGIGQSAVRTVAVDSRGKMDVDELRRAIGASREKGERPFYVCATIGTTVLGAFDDLKAVAGVLDEDASTTPTRPRVHLHVDASWGGALLFHPTLRALLDGVSRSDSCTVNPHKLLGVPLQCSLLLVRHPSLLMAATAMRADYLFHSHSDDELDLGAKTLQCGRHNDALKLYLAWCLHSDAHFTTIVDKAAMRAIFFARLIRSDRRYSLLFLSPASNVCFFYLAPSVRDRWHLQVGPALAAACSLPVDSHADVASYDWSTCHLPPSCASMADFFPQLDGLPARLYRAMQLDGRLLINFATLPEYSRSIPTFFRIVLHNPLTSVTHLQLILDVIDELATSLEGEDSLQAHPSSLSR